MDADRKDRARSEPREAVFFGARHDLERTVTSHLFVLCPNNGGSTFMQKALRTSRRTWNLSYEGQKVLGYVGPRFKNDRRMLGSGRMFAARRRWLDVLGNPAAYDWPRTRKAWYFQSHARDPGASIFVEKSPECFGGIGPSWSISDTSSWTRTGACSPLHHYDVLCARRSPPRPRLGLEERGVVTPVEPLKELHPVLDFQGSPDQPEGRGGEPA